jgi:hypothetical protein
MRSLGNNIRVVVCPLNHFVIWADIQTNYEFSDDEYLPSDDEYLPSDDEDTTNVSDTGYTTHISDSD